jgi:hypothetical protein
VLRGELAQAEKRLSSGSDGGTRCSVNHSQAEDRLQSRRTATAGLCESRSPISSATDLRWRDASEIQFRLFDGHVFYFGREPSNIYRFCGEPGPPVTQMTASQVDALPHG